MEKSRKRWVVYSPEEIEKNGQKWILKREFNEFFTEKEASKHFSKLKNNYGNAEIEVKKAGPLYNQQ
ncbi:MAG: hypothetical protein ACRC5T_09025 [Cetobacterium sp.]